MVNLKRTRAGYSVSPALVRISYGRKLIGCQLLTCGFELSDLTHQTIDARGELFDLTLVLGCGFSAHVSFSEQIDVTIVFTNDQIMKILVIEALAFVGLVADDSIVVQVDLNIVQVLVFQNVKYSCFAVFLCFAHNCYFPPVVFDGLIA